MKKKLKWILLSFAILIFIILTIVLYPYFLKILTDEAERLAFKSYIESLGALGWFFLLFVIIIQMVLAFIPGEPIEIMAGVMYGAFGGLALCLIGSLIGTIIIYFMVKKIGSGKQISNNDKVRFAFLQKEDRLDAVVFFLFFIPGTPKDAITYLVPFTKMPALKFFIISTIARIPSIITSTFVGGSLIEGNIRETIIIFLITAIISIIGLVINKIYLDHKNKATE